MTTQFIKVGSQEILRSEKVRNLGAIFDCNANMEHQVMKTAQTAWYHLHAIVKIQRYLTKEQTQSIIHAYVTSRLDQNNSLLGGTTKELLNKLQRIQNAAAKIITGGKKHDHVTPLLKTLHWLPLSKRCIFKILLLVYKALHGNGPEYFKDLLKPLDSYNTNCQLRSFSQNQLRVSKTQCVIYGDRSFSVLGPRLWNELPLHIKSSATTAVFKLALKTHLFKAAYD